jgi:hypothetical protein
MFSTVPRSVSDSKIFSGLVSFIRFFGVTLRPFSLLVVILDCPLFWLFLTEIVRKPLSSLSQGHLQLTPEECLALVRLSL